MIPAVGERASGSATRAERLEALFERPVVAMELIGEADPSSLHVEEAAQVARAIGKRRGEFAGGRLCARSALVQLGVPEEPIPIEAHRGPRWPAGVTGSITHTRGYCAAVVAPASTYRGIGIDAEVFGRLPHNLWSRVCTPRELRATAGPDQAQWVAVAFSAKEALFKCQYPIAGLWLDFLDVELSFDPLARTHGRIGVEGVDAGRGLARLGRFSGRYTVTDPLVLAAVSID